VAVVGGLLVAINHPFVFLALLVGFLLLLIWLLPKIWRVVKRVFGGLGRFFRGKAEPPVTAEGATPGTDRTSIQEGGGVAPGPHPPPPRLTGPREGG
jgi:hypothetical protein